MRAFFFGPGLPRGLGAPSSNCDAVRFRPGFGPDAPFRFDPFVGGARRALPVAAGVEAALESEAFGAGEGALRSAGVEARGVNAMESDGNLARRVDESNNLMTFDLDGLEENFEVVGTAAGVVVEADMAMYW
jgi:hypothetical protein